MKQGFWILLAALLLVVGMPDVALAATSHAKYVLYGVFTVVGIGLMLFAVCRGNNR